MSSQADLSLPPYPYDLPSIDDGAEPVVAPPAYIAPVRERTQGLVFTFRRAPHGGWHVLDDDSLVYNITYLKASPIYPHEVFEVHDGEGGVS